jgi:hypothetical protein
MLFSWHSSIKTARAKYSLTDEKTCINGLHHASIRRFCSFKSCVTWGIMINILLQWRLRYQNTKVKLHCTTQNIMTEHYKLKRNGNENTVNETINYRMRHILHLWKNIADKPFYHAFTSAKALDKFSLKLGLGFKCVLVPMLFRFFAIVILLTCFAMALVRLVDAV